MFFKRINGKSQLMLDRRTFLKGSIFAVGAAAIRTPAHARKPRASKAGDRPNIVFILADDLGWRDLSNEGSRFYESPHIDRIAREGMKFTQGYAACSVCSPSRASILTGKYPTKHGITSWIGGRSGAEYVHALRAEEITIAEALRTAGYKTFFAGKWHLGGKEFWPTRHGFDINKGGWDAGGPRGGFFSPYRNPNLEDGPNGESLPIRLAKETASFIEAGSTSAVPVSGIDWYPTFLELADVPTPKAQDIDGVSLVPVLKGGSIAERPLFWHYPHNSPQGGEPSSIITRNSWKLIHYHEDHRDELYHLTADPGEQKDLANDEPERAKALRAELDIWLKATDAKFPKNARGAWSKKRQEQRIKWLETTVKPRLEKSHAEFLDENYEPNKNWWGSVPKN